MAVLEQGGCVYIRPLAKIGVVCTNAKRKFIKPHPSCELGGANKWGKILGGSR